MNPTMHLDALLEELYAIEPSLRGQDAALRRLASELLAAKPDAVLDAEFAARLRRELVARAAHAPRENAFARFFAQMRPAYLVPGLAVLALIVTVNLVRPLGPSGVGTKGERASAPGVTRLASNAFGSLTGATSGGGRTPLGGGGGGAPVASLDATSATLPSQAGGGQGDSKLIAPGEWTPVSYVYSYKGDALTDLSDTVDVYRRTKAPNGPGPVAALRGFDLGLMDLGKLQSASLQSFTFVEDRTDGYAINVNAEEGTINVYENGRWSFPERQCTDQACIESYRLKESDMPADADAIRVADAFLAELGVNRDGYGEAVVRDDWRTNYARTSDKSSYWFPDTIAVVYPYVIDGKPATDETGAPYGLNVNVNVRHMRATGIWNLSSHAFEASSYAGETDAKRLIAVAERAGNFYGAPEAAQKVEISLGTPRVELSRLWRWDGSQGYELFVPSLVFPVVDAPKDFWQTSVTVPLAKDLLQDASGGPIIMPLDAAR